MAVVNLVEASATIPSGAPIQVFTIVAISQVRATVRTDKPTRVRLIPNSGDPVVLLGGRRTRRGVTESEIVSLLGRTWNFELIDEASFVYLECSRIDAP